MDEAYTRIQKFPLSKGMRVLFGLCFFNAFHVLQREGIIT